MRLSIGPNPYFWSRDATYAFYRAAVNWPVEVIYLGETICSKRRELRTRDWIALAAELAASGKEIVLSTLALIEAESELSALRRMLDDGRFLVEANDLSAVHACCARGVGFVAGPTLNIYNHRALALLVEDGLQRWVPAAEQGRQQIDDIRNATAAEGGRMPELEVCAWGRLPLAYSARCFTARALKLGKDDCAFRCLEFPSGLELKTREGEPFLRINGIQIQGAEVCDLAPQLAQLHALGVDLVRLTPQAEGMAEVCDRFRTAIDSGVSVPRLGASNGYWDELPGRESAAMC